LLPPEPEPDLLPPEPEPPWALPADPVQPAVPATKAPTRLILTRLLGIERVMCNLPFCRRRNDQSGRDDAFTRAIGEDTWSPDSWVWVPGDESFREEFRGAAFPGATAGLAERAGCDMCDNRRRGTRPGRARPRPRFETRPIRDGVRRASLGGPRRGRSKQPSQGSSSKMLVPSAVMAFRPAEPQSDGRRGLVPFAVAMLAGGMTLLSSCAGAGTAKDGAGGAAGQPDGGAGGGALGGGGAGGAIAVAKALAEFTTAFCTAARTCCTAVPGAEGLLADCETTLPSTSMRYAAIARGTVVPDLNRLPACTAALQQAATACLVPDACQDLWQGTKVPGDSCSQGVQALECRTDAGDTLCYRAAGTMPGVFTGICQPAPRGTVGTPCVSSCGPGIVCSQALYATPSSPMAICYTQDGLYCESAACAPISATGAPCTADPQCGTESYCATTCTPRKAAGQPCLQDHECSQVAHLYCVNDVCSAASLASDAVCGGDLF